MKLPASKVNFYIEKPDLTKNIALCNRYDILEKIVGLSDDRRLFFEIRDKCEVIVRKHAFEDYPQRGFSEREIIDLVQKGKGNFTDNNSLQAIEGSYLFFPKDDLDRECKLVILIEEIYIEDEDSKEGDQVIVCSAYREAVK